MNKFSVFNYDQLSDYQKDDFNKALAQGLTSIKDEIKSGEESNLPVIEEFIASSGQCSDSATIVVDLYSHITSGIQAGSGNQNLFLDILAKYIECWEKVNR